MRAGSPGEIIKRRQHAGHQEMQVPQTMAMITVALLLQMILCLMPFTAAAADSAVTRSCGDNSTTDTSSTYQANLQLLSAALPKNASSSSLYARGSAGGSDAAYGLALCRGDTSNASACGGCVDAAFREALRLCGPASNNAHVVYETCAVHVSSRDFVYRADDVLGGLLFVSDPPLPGSDPADAESANAIGGLIDVLLRETGMQTAYDSTTRYATGRMDVNSSGPLPALYSLAQCVPDLRPVDCWGCLRTINGMASTYFAGRYGGRADGVWCNFRYGAHQFYSGKPMRRIDSSGAALLPSTNKTAPNQKHKGRMIKVLIIATTVPLLALLLGFFVCIGLIRRHRKGKSSSHEEELVWGIEGSSELMFFSFSQVSDATSNFSDENKLGQGGFGPVYKGRLADGSDVAIKRLASHSVQGLTEFQNEVQLIAKLQHTNLVRLMGCCSHGEEKILIYEYLPNKSLDFFIFDETRRLSLSWSKRLQIIEGIAQGILYLHKHSRLRVIHRDLKASNILLDQDMNPKISDFGLAKIFNSNDTEGNTKRIAGTYGYMAPEYASKGIFSFKSDVFSFGVLLLEIISGTRNSGFHQYGNFFDLLGYAWKLWNEERWLELIDASLVSEFHTSEMMRCVNIALICVEENAAERPTMSDVVAMLNNESITIPEPRHPAYLHLRVTPAVPGPSNINDMTISTISGR